MQNPCACREPYARISLRQIFKILHRGRTFWLLVTSHTLLVPSVTGSSNSCTCLKQADWSCTLPVTRELCITFQSRNRATPNAKIQWCSDSVIRLFNRMKTACCEGAVRAGIHPGWDETGATVPAGQCLHLQGAVPLSQGQASRAGWWQHGVLSTAQWSSGNGKAASQHHCQPRKSKQ